jgi:hypothetical protein
MYDVTLTAPYGATMVWHSDRRSVADARNDAWQAARRRLRLTPSVLPLTGWAVSVSPCIPD